MTAEELRIICDEVYFELDNGADEKDIAQALVRRFGEEEGNLIIDCLVGLNRESGIIRKRTVIKK